MGDEEEMSDYDFSEDKFILAEATELGPSTIQVKFGLAQDPEDKGVIQVTKVDQCYAKCCIFWSEGLLKSR